MNASGNVVILVVSCDKYADVWAPFFGVFWKRWPDCPYPVYLGSNWRKWDDPRVTNLTVGDDVSWTHGARTMLDRIAASHVILFLEDFILTRAVDTDRVVEMVELAARQQLHHLRLVPKMAPSRRLVEYSGLGEYPPGHNNRVSTQVAVWRKDTLKELLKTDSTAWDFELKGSYLSSRFPDKFWGVYRPVLHYFQSVEGGIWRREGVYICRQAGVQVDQSARRVLSCWGTLCRYGQYVVGDVRNLLRELRYGSERYHPR